VELFKLMLSIAMAANPAPKIQKHDPEKRGSGTEKNQTMDEMNDGPKIAK